MEPSWHYPNGPPYESSRGQAKAASPRTRADGVGDNLAHQIPGVSTEFCSNVNTMSLHSAQAACKRLEEPGRTSADGCLPADAVATDGLRAMGRRRWISRLLRVPRNICVRSIAGGAHSGVSARTQRDSGFGRVWLHLYRPRSVAPAHRLRAFNAASAPSWQALRKATHAGGLKPHCLVLPLTFADARPLLPETGRDRLQIRQVQVGRAGAPFRVRPRGAVCPVRQNRSMQLFVALDDLSLLADLSDRCHKSEEEEEK